MNTYEYDIGPKNSALMDAVRQHGNRLTNAQIINHLNTLHLIEKTAFARKLEADFGGEKHDPTR